MPASNTTAQSTYEHSRRIDGTAAARSAGAHAQLANRRGENAGALESYAAETVTAATTGFGGYQDFLAQRRKGGIKYRNAWNTRNQLGHNYDPSGKYRYPQNYQVPQLAWRSLKVGTDDYTKAAQFAANTPGVLFQWDGSKGGALYDFRKEHGGHYDDVEDGFTEDRTNYDETTVTLQGLAEQVKTLKRDLARAGIL